MNSNLYPIRGASDLKVAVREEQITAVPGNETDLQVIVQNQGPQDEDVAIEVTGVPASWIVSEIRFLRVAAGQTMPVLLTILPPPIPGEPRRPVSAGDPSGCSGRSESSSDRAHHTDGGCLRIPWADRPAVGCDAILRHPGFHRPHPRSAAQPRLEEESFQLGVTGLPANWVSADLPITRLAPGESREIMVTLQVPRSPQADAGRTPFVIQVSSQMFPDEVAEASFILTVAAFSQFTATLEFVVLGAGQPGRVTISNQGNTASTYSLNFQSPGNLLVFQKPVQVTRPGPQPGTQRVEAGYAEIPSGDRFQVEAGQSAVYPFRTQLRSRPFVGGETSYPYSVTVTSSEGRVQDLSGQLVELALLPVWLPVVGIVAAFGFCLLLMLFSFRNLPSSATATQTAVFNLTQTALAVRPDADRDGLSDVQESALWHRSACGRYGWRHAA